MKKIALFVAFIVVLCLAGSTNGQSKQKPQDPDGRNPAIVVIGSAAKVGWVTTKFAAKHVAKPVAKTLLVKGGPKAAKFMLKSSGFGAKHLLPIAVKLALL